MIAARNTGYLLYMIAKDCTSDNTPMLRRLTEGAMYILQQQHQVSHLLAKLKQER
jgi:hypothetical protein